MTELVETVELIGSVGTPLLMTVVVIYALYKGVKHVPKIVEQQKEERTEQQRFYNDRQKAYEDQMAIVVKVAEQGNAMIGQATQVIAQSSEVIRMNTEAIKNNTVVHDRVITALGNDLTALQTLTRDLKVHDHRAEKIHTGMEKLLDRTD